MTNVKVSVIIPVFNTAEYLIESVGSIQSQTLKDVEILVVNDGSTDNSLEVLQQIAASDNRVKIIEHTKNKGLSEARNTGMEHMQGEYFYLFDSDDILEKDCLELCYNRCKNDNLDFLFFDAEVFNDTGINAEHNLNYKRTDLLKQGIYKGDEILKILVNKRIYKEPVWLNFINSTYFSTTGLKFYPGIYHEDILFTSKLYLLANRVGFINRSFFHRRIRSNSIMSSISIKNINDMLFSIHELIRFKSERPASQQRIINHISRRMLRFVTKKSAGFSVKVLIQRIPEITYLYLRCLC